MKVRELIDALSKIKNQDLEVFGSTPGGCDDDPTYARPTIGISEELLTDGGTEFEALVLNVDIDEVYDFVGADPFYEEEEER